MQQLNLPPYPIQVRKGKLHQEIYDVIRKKFVALTPEEWVRQNFIHYLSEEKAYPQTLIAVEMSLKVNNMQKRSDIVIFDRNGKPVLIVECKAPEVKIDQKVFDQIAVYNMKLQTQFLIVTNGIRHIACQLNLSDQSYQFLKEIPTYQQIIQS